MSGTLRAGARRTLRHKAHDLKPTVMVGKDGATLMVAQALDEQLLAHELVKVRFVEHKEEKQALADDLARAAGAATVGLIGHVAILYRPHPETEKRRYGISLRS